MPQHARRARRRRRTALRVAAVACAVAAVVFGVANITPAGNDSGVASAQAQTILRHIRDDLKWPPHAIYEEEEVGTVTTPNGVKTTSKSQVWISTSPPYNMRLIRPELGKVQWEQAFVNGRLDLYDPASNTIYLAPRIAPNQVTDKPQWNSALSAVQSLLSGQPLGNAGNVTINPHAVLDGKPAIELTFDGGRFSYWISRSTYQPLQSEDRQDPRPHDGVGVGIVRYPIARVLTGASASPKLLSLQAQHPGATIDHRSTDYDAALKAYAPNY